MFLYAAMKSLDLKSFATIFRGARPAQNIIITAPVVTPNHNCHKNDTASVVKLSTKQWFNEKTILLQRADSKTPERMPKTAPLQTEQQSHASHKQDLPNTVKTIKATTQQSKVERNKTAGRRYTVIAY